MGDQSNRNGSSEDQAGRGSRPAAEAPSRLNYASAGVDTARGDAFVDWIQSQTGGRQPFADHILEGVGGFAALFRFPFQNYRKPCLVSCTDGVGTKVKLASHFEDFSTIGQDLVAMCVNDLICTGGRPLFFLDYYATGKLELESAKSFLSGVRKACHQSNCALIGGETAEMPGVYQGNDFDCAGFAVGVVEEDERWGAHRVQPGDHVFALSSSGFHSNGYSLLRKVFEKDLVAYKDLLLTPTALYVAINELVRAELPVRAAAHITGGGIENIPRVLPEGWNWEMKDWPWPEHFHEVQRRTGMSDQEMQTSLNCGIGFCYLLPADSGPVLKRIAERFGHLVYDLGPVRP